MITKKQGHQPRKCSGWFENLAVQIMTDFLGLIWFFLQRNSQIAWPFYFDQSCVWPSYSIVLCLLLHKFYFLDFLLHVAAPFYLVCENIRFSSLSVAEDVSRRGTSATQWQKFHTDDANQCLHNKSGSHGVPNINLSNFMCLLVDFGSAVFICQRAPAKLKYFF